MFDLATFDARQQLPRGAIPRASDRALSLELRSVLPSPFRTRMWKCGALALALFLVTAFLPYVASTIVVTGPWATTAEEMTYNGMNIAEFALSVGMAVDDPILIALFETLCMTQDKPLATSLSTAMR